MQGIYAAKENQIPLIILINALLDIIAQHIAAVESHAQLEDSAQ